MGWKRSIARDDASESFGIAQCDPLGQRCTFRALRLAPVGVVAPFHYGELLFAALFGWVFWREWPGAHVWWGAVFVVGAGLYTLWRERARTLVSG